MPRDPISDKPGGTEDEDIRDSIAEDEDEGFEDLDEEGEDEDEFDEEEEATAGQTDLTSEIGGEGGGTGPGLP
jgi:hypothetical protein